MSNELMVIDDKQIEEIKNTICKGATNDELNMFIQVCKQTQLNPFKKQIYAVKRWDSQLRREVMTPQVSVDGLRAIAERSGKYEGQTATYWCGEDGIWKDLWNPKKGENQYPLAAKVGVYKTGFKEPLYGIAKWDAYAQHKKDGGLTSMWAKMPDLMLAKCAESTALRRAFPNDLSGTYSAEEMSQADSTQEIIEPKTVKQVTPITESKSNDHSFKLPEGLKVVNGKSINDKLSGQLVQVTKGPEVLVKPDYTQPEVVDPEFIDESQELSHKTNDPSTFVVTFGPHAGQTFGEIGQVKIKEMYENQSATMKKNSLTEPKTPVGKLFRQKAEEFLNVQ